MLIYCFSCLVDWFCYSTGFLAWSIGFAVALVSAWSFGSAVLLVFILLGHLVLSFYWLSRLVNWFCPSVDFLGKLVLPFCLYWFSVLLFVFLLGQLVVLVFLLCHLVAFVSFLGELVVLVFLLSELVVLVFFLGELVVLVSCLVNRFCWFLAW